MGDIYISIVYNETISDDFRREREREKAPYEHREDSSSKCGRSHSSASPLHRPDRESTSTRYVLKVNTPRTYASGASPFPSALPARGGYAPN